MPANESPCWDDADSGLESFTAGCIAAALATALATQGDPGPAGRSCLASAEAASPIASGCGSEPSFVGRTGEANGIS